MAQEIIDNGLCDVDEYWGVEVPYIFLKFMQVLQIVLVHIKVNRLL